MRIMILGNNMRHLRMMQQEMREKLNTEVDPNKKQHRFGGMPNIWDILTLRNGDEMVFRTLDMPPNRFCGITINLVYDKTYYEPMLQKKRERIMSELACRLAVSGGEIVRE